MTVITRRAHEGVDFGTDFRAVRDFLLRINATTPLASPEFLWGRWEWAFCLPYLERSHLAGIGIWEAGGQVVGLATHESVLGEAYLAVDPLFRAQLLPELADHALAQLHDGAGLGVPVGEEEHDLAAVLAERGFSPIDRYEETSVLELADPPGYRLADGYTLTNFAEGVDLHRFNRCLHRGFDHPEPVPTDDETLYWRGRSCSAPSLIPELNTVVVAPDGEYAAYCGIFFDPTTDYLLVEPVCTAPAHRRRGCGRAAVAEAVTRAAALGARLAYVGSSQQFYYDLGFVPFHRSQWWHRQVAGAQ